MKNFKYLVVAFISVFTIACSSDDDSSENDTSADLVGTWTSDDFEYDGESIVNVGGQDFTTTFVGAVVDGGVTVTFGENPNTVTSSGAYDIEVTSTFQGETSTQVVNDISFLSDGTWSRDGSELTVITTGNDPDVSTIVTLNGTTLILESTEVQEVVSPQGTSTSTVNVRIVLTRQ